MFEKTSTLDQARVLTDLNKSFGKVVRRYWHAQTRVFGTSPTSQKVTRLLEQSVGTPPDRVWLELIDQAFQQGGFLDFV